MDNPNDKMPELFAQLGLDNEPDAIRQFICDHRPVPDGMRLYDAPFWSVGQAALIKEKLQQDDDWSIVIDTLNVQLRHIPIL